METIDPNGNAISKITVGGSAPTESLWMLAKTTGNYQIRISAVNAKGYFGRYIIRLEEVAELKTAPSSDQSYVKANQLYWEATALSDQGGDQPLHQAAEKFQEVLL